MHTPGPWKLGGIFNPGTEHERYWVWGPTPPGKQSGDVVCRDAQPENARLIAAAPDLLKALKRIRDLDVACSQQEDRAAWNEAHAAIEKAEGAATPGQHKTDKAT